MLLLVVGFFFYCRSIRFVLLNPFCSWLRERGGGSSNYAEEDKIILIVLLEESCLETDNQFDRDLDR